MLQRVNHETTIVFPELLDEEWLKRYIWKSITYLMKHLLRCIFFWSPLQNGSSCYRDGYLTRPQYAGCTRTLPYSIHNRGPVCLACHATHHAKRREEKKDFVLMLCRTSVQYSTSCRLDGRDIFGWRGRRPSLSNFFSPDLRLRKKLGPDPACGYILMCMPVYREKQEQNGRVSILYSSVEIRCG